MKSSLLIERRLGAHCEWHPSHLFSIDRDHNRVISGDRDRKIDNEDAGRLNLFEARRRLPHPQDSIVLQSDLAGWIV